MAQNKVTGSYAFDKVFPLVDYCGEYAGGVAQHSSIYSPNNIRRVIISPDGVMVHYYLPVKGKKTGLARLAPIMVAKAAELQDYVPMLSILHKGYICASVEEVLVLSVSGDGKYTLSSRELDFEGLVSTFRNKGKDLLETVKQRYVRLHSFCVAPMSLNQFMAGVQHIGKCDFISDTPLMADAKKQEIHPLVEDGKHWFERWGSSGQAYDMDKVDGSLYMYFTKVMQDKSAALKASAVAKSSDERLGSLKDEFLSELRQYRGVFNCYNRQARLKDACLLYSGKLDIVRTVPLLKCEGLEGYQSFTEVKSDGKEPTNKADAMRDNIARMKKARMDLYLLLLRDFLTELDKLSQTRPVTCKFLLSECDCAVFVPDTVSSLTAINKALGERFGYNLSGASFIDSMANLCALRVSFFYPDADKSMRNKSYWRGGLR